MLAPSKQETTTTPPADTDTSISHLSVPRPEVAPSAEPTLSKSSTEFFAEKFLTSLIQKDFDAISNILDADPYMNGGRPQEGSSPVVASPMEYAPLVQRYKDGGVHGQRYAQSPLSPDGAKAFDMLASWYQVYRAAFPDATETESLQNIFEYLKDTRNGDMKWGICLKADQYGNVQAAFSGQVLEASVPSSAGQETTIPFAWGEHVFVDRDIRGRGLGREMVAGFEEQFSKNFGKVPVVVIEVDNAFGILDRKDPSNAGFFNHENLAHQRDLWTDPEGQNMAMNPFERLRAWSKLGFKLITVERADLKAGEDRVAMPYTQVPLNEGGEPCETLVLAVRITDPSIIKKIETGEWTVKEFNAMYAAMQQTIDEEYQQNPAFNAAQAEMKILKRGDTSRVKLVDFLNEDGRTLNPEALTIMARTADEKLTQEKCAPAGPTSPSPGVTRERFNAEMTFEPRGYRPVAFYGSVEQALASKVDPAKFEVFVDVKKGGFTAEEVAAIPDNAKRNNYHIGFARQLFDVNEGIFTKGFWTSSEGIKKVLTAGFIKAETEEIHLEAAQWLLSRREAATPPLTSSPTDENSPAMSSEQDIGDDRFKPPVQEASLTTPVPRNEPKIFEMADLNPLETRLQERFAALKASIAPRTLTVVVEDSASIDAVIQNLQFHKDFNTAFAEQVSKTQAVLEQVGKLGLDQPSQGGVFKKKKEDALRLIDSLSFSKSDLALIADKIVSVL